MRDDGKGWAAIRSAAAAGALTGAAMLACAPAARAQAALSAFAEEYNRGRNSGVLERARPEYATSGISVGAFTLSPALSLDGYYDDNVFAARTAKRSDEVLRIAPTVSLNSDWSRNSLHFDASLSHDEHLRVGGETTTDYSVGASGAVEVLSDIALSASYQHSRLTESRFSSSTAASAPEPSQYDHDGLSAAAVDQLGKIRLRAALSFDRDDFSDLRGADGSLILNSRRSNDVVVLGLRGDYALTADTSVFAAVSYDVRSFGSAVTPVGAYDQRDSDGTQLLVGANFDLTNLIRGEIGVGYFSQNLSGPSPAQGLVGVGGGGSSGLSASARVDYFPTQLTTVSVSASRGFTNSTTLDAPGDLSTNAGVRVDHELKRNLLLFAQAGVGIDEFVRIDRTDVRYNISAGATYYMNRAVQLNGRFTHLSQSSQGRQSGYEYDDNQFLIGVTLRR